MADDDPRPGRLEPMNWADRLETWLERSLWSFGAWMDAHHALIFVVVAVVPLLLLAIGSFAEYIDEHRKPKDNREGWRP